MFHNNIIVTMKKKQTLSNCWFSDNGAYLIWITQIHHTRMSHEIGRVKKVEHSWLHESMENEIQNSLKKIVFR